jgi:hypothetical protein
LEEALLRRLGEAQVEREDGVAGVPAAAEGIGERGAAGHRQGHEAGHATSVRGSERAPD